MSRAHLHIGVGGPVGTGKTALIEALVPRLVEMGDQVLVVTNDIVTTEDAEHVRRTLAGVLSPERIVGVETGTCPHSAVREDPSLNLLAMEELETRFPGADWLFIESGGDNLTLSFSPAVADLSMYVIDVAGGEKIPRKRGPGLIQADLLVINKTDLADLVGARLEVMAADAGSVRDGRPTIFTNCKTGDGIGAVLAWLEAARRRPPERMALTHGRQH
jgi:urease accessory protein